MQGRGGRGYERIVAGPKKTRSIQEPRRSVNAGTGPVVAGADARVASTAGQRMTMIWSSGLRAMSGTTHPAAG